MAAVQELDGFYFHFKHLLFYGHEASLQINSLNGKATVTLTAGFKAMNNCKVAKKQRSPSYYNRLERRKKERKEKAEEASEESNNETEEMETVTDMSQNEVAAAEAATVCEENVAVEAQAENVAEEAKELVVEANTGQVDVAEKQRKKMKWFCNVHGCMVEHRKEAECSCCGDRCEGVAYSDDEDDDQFDPP